MGGEVVGVGEEEVFREVEELEEGDVAGLFGGEVGGWVGWWVGLGRGERGGLNELL